YCNINAFSLNEPVEGLHLDMEIFIDSKPDFYTFQNDTKKLTGAEVVALFNPE
ncbi:MAG TPA: S-(hydroxymethyl)glutathione synthase, partial [Acinetobacter nosocomialis]|nr:S-(hydroxymethyl)glutathione synthase [Acinetobacter nosocomialis]